MLIIEIEPLTGFGRTATKIGLRIPEYVPNSNKVLFHYQFIDSDNLIVMEKSITLDEEIVANWGTDDNYIIDAVLNQLEVTPLPPQE